jgi:hypothetical protein
MNIFKKLFFHNEPSEETMLLTNLRELSDALRPHNSHWASVLVTLHQEAADEFIGGASVSKRYQIARKIESLFGGMGSLNDIEMPGDCKRLHDELFSAVESVLRDYWRALGRESHTGTIRPLPVGASVHLVPGTVRYFERDESPVLVEDKPAVRSQLWQVVRYDGPDITNMPSYLVQHNETFMNARHEALELVRE